MAKAVDHKVGQPPPPAAIIDAYRQMLRYFKKYDKVPVDHNTYALIRALEYLLHESETLVTTDDLKETLRRIRKGKNSEHVYLAKMAFERLGKLDISDTEDLECALDVYASAGDVESCSEAMANWKLGSLSPQMWKSGLRACLVAEDLEGAEKLWEVMENEGFKINEGTFGLFLSYYSRKNDVDNARMWFLKLQDSLKDTRVLPSRGKYGNLFSALVNAIEKGHPKARQWAESHLRELEETVLQFAAEDDRANARSTMILLLQWSALVEGEEKFGNLTKEMIRKATERREGAGRLLIPNEETIIELMEFFIAHGYLTPAERVATQWPEQWLLPNTDEIKLVEMRLMLEKGDLISALRIRDILSTTPVVQSYKYAKYCLLLLQRVASEHWVPVDLVDRLYEDLEADKIEFDTPSVTALALYLARTRKVVPLIDLLQKFVHVMPRDDRTSVLLALGNMASAPDTELQDALMIYQVCFQLFPEMGPGLYTDFMRLFFAYGSVDLALKVFQQMVQTPGANPTEETYIAVLYGIANGEAELSEVRMVHRSIKLDTEITRSVELQNALIAAYTSVDYPQYAIDTFWEQWRTEEGPNHITINLALEACRRFRTTSHMNFTISEIWKKLKSHKAYLDEKNYYYLFIAFLQADNAAQAYNVMLELREKGFKVTPQMLALLQRNYDSVEEWEKVRKWAAINEWDAYREWEDNKAAVMQSVENILRLLWIEPIVEPDVEPTTIEAPPTTTQPEHGVVQKARPRLERVRLVIEAQEAPTYEESDEMERS